MYILILGAGSKIFKGFTKNYEPDFGYEIEKEPIFMHLNIGNQIYNFQRSEIFFVTHFIENHCFTPRRPFGVGNGKSPI